MTGSERLLEVEHVSAHYGPAQALFDVSFGVGHGERIGILGVNGVGKTTLSMVLAGLLKPTAGSVRFDGREITGYPAHRVAASGIALVPQGRRVFGSLTVEENIRVAAHGRGSRGSIGDVYDLFPALEVLQKRFAATLSGGEQQMLAIARALVRGPRLLILDEPTEGLAPIMIDRLREALGQLAESELAVLLLEQRRPFAERLSGRIVEMAERGVLSAP
jgi:branched-chain amino acid transport system ATP-binding protein